MATIQQAISLADGVSPVLGKIGRNVDKTIGQFNRAAGAATRMEAAAEQGSMGIANGVEMAMGPVGRLGGMVTNLSGKLRTAGSGAFSGLREAMSGVAGQFAIATVAANAFMAVLSQLGELPGRLIKASDAYAGIMARLRLVAGGAQKAAELNELIYSSAQRARGSYDQMADSVSKIAMTAKKAFPDPKEVVPFMEGIQKLFVIGGTGIEQQKDALLQLTQALGSGKLQGDEFRSIAEAAPLIEQMVAKYMQIDPGKLKEISSQGEITADILKNAILTNMGEIDSQFQSMGTTWGQRWQQIENAGQKAFAPALIKINELANSPGAQRFSELVVAGLVVAANAVSGLINNMQWLAGVIGEVGSYVGSWLGAGFQIAGQYMEEFLEIGMAGLAIYAGYWIATNLLVDGYVLSVAAATLVEWGMIAAGYAKEAILALLNLRTTIAIALTSAWTMVTNGLRGAWMLLNIVMSLNPIGVVIALVAVAIGVFAAWSLHTYGLRNALASAFSTMAGIVANAVNFMIDKINGLIKMINKAAEGINSLFGTSIGQVGEISYRADAGAWSKAAGDFVQNFDIHDYIPTVSMPDMTGSAGGVGGYPGAAYGDTGGGVPDEGSKAAKDTAGNTGRMADAMDIEGEDLKYLREMATQEAISRYTTAEVKIDMGGINNNISSGVDVDGMMTYLNDSLIEAMKAGAEEVHPT